VSRQDAEFKGEEEEEGQKERGSGLKI